MPSQHDGSYWTLFYKTVEEINDKYIQFDQFEKKKIKKIDKLTSVCLSASPPPTLGTTALSQQGHWFAGSIIKNYWNLDI